MKINKLTFIEKEKKYRGYSDNKQMWLNQYLKIQKSLSVDFRSTPPLLLLSPSILHDHNSTHRHNTSKPQKILSRKAKRTKNDNNDVASASKQAGSLFLFLWQVSWISISFSFIHFPFILFLLEPKNYQFDLDLSRIVSKKLRSGFA